MKQLLSSYIILRQLKLLADISGKDEANTANKLNSLTDKAKKLQKTQVNYPVWTIQHAAPLHPQPCMYELQWIYDKEQRVNRTIPSGNEQWKQHIRLCWTYQSRPLCVGFVGTAAFIQIFKKGRKTVKKKKAITSVSIFSSIYYYVYYCVQVMSH